MKTLCDAAGGNLVQQDTGHEPMHTSLQITGHDDVGPTATEYVGGGAGAGAGT